MKLQDPISPIKAVHFWYDKVYNNPRDGGILHGNEENKLSGVSEEYHN
jgi:hypothetical protein